MIDLEVLLTEIAPDLPWALIWLMRPGFWELELAAQGKPERQFGETVIEPRNLNWNEVRARH
ncbi:MAG: hypothetical protein IPF44_07015 [Betaproteobacteria bacterium]|nr:hypothetical protein [Betaproteobacteria bacterium]